MPTTTEPTLQPGGTTVFRMLDISTTAVSKQTAEWLQAYIDDADWHNPGPVAYDKGEYGWIVNVSPELQGLASAAEVQEAHYGPNSTVPEDLINVLLYAVKAGCQWVMFDCDGGKVPDALPTFEW